jgi:hypothetical protein
VIVPPEHPRNRDKDTCPVVEYPMRCAAVFILSEAVEPAFNIPVLRSEKAICPVRGVAVPIYTS